MSAANAEPATNELIARRERRIFFILSLGQWGLKSATPFILCTEQVNSEHRSKCPLAPIDRGLSPMGNIETRWRLTSTARPRIRATAATRTAVPRRVIRASAGPASGVTLIPTQVY